MSEAPARVGVLGAGTMGCGIALSFALAGSSVRIHARRDATRERARRRLAAGLEALIAHGGLGLDAAGDAGARIELVADGDDAVAGAALVVESIVEDLAVKAEVLGRAEAAAPPDALLTTNTSSLPLAALSESLPEITKKDLSPATRTGARAGKQNFHGLRTNDFSSLFLLRSSNPNGIAEQSPRLRACELPWVETFD